ncbi:thiol-disulfide oxidoreductase DCC family protein [Glycomyces rhizosphaerae]|uniref:Thiol-disulfide oxidoreductase DCC family protein n=1 Tax=Glycomyces rhizosphaerae TaxID=2054422 RepID=A0ABV7Q0K9_9ACTN
MTHTFLYDGDCAFCTKAAQFLEKHVRTTAEVTPWQWADLAGLGVSQAQAEEAVIWVEANYQQAGPDAIAVLLRRAQWYWRPIGWFLSFKLVSKAAWPVYRLISRNRHKLPGGTAACSLPQAERDRLTGR